MSRRGAWREPTPGGAPQRRTPPRLPRWVLPLGMLVALEPALLLVLWLADRDLADGSLAGIAIVGGLLVSVPALAILGLAVVWDRRMAAGDTVPGSPPGLTGPRASRVTAVALALSTLLMAAVIGALIGPWALVALPPLALSLVSAWLMARAA